MLSQHSPVNAGARRSSSRARNTCWTRSSVITTRRSRRADRLVSDGVTPMDTTAVRPGHGTEQALLDAAERLLVEVGAAGITTRRVAEEAKLNHGLVHYYFGSVEQLLVRVLERFTDRLVERQREMYAADVPFLEKWR